LSHVIPNLFNPIPTFFISKVKNQNNTITRLKVCGNDGSVLFLSGSVPNAKTDCFIFNFDLFVSKIDGCNSYIEGLLIFDVSPEDGGFACSTITNQYDFVSEFIGKVVLY